MVHTNIHNTTTKGPYLDVRKTKNGPVSSGDQQSQGGSTKKNDKYGAWGPIYKNKQHFVDMHICWCLFKGNGYPAISRFNGTWRIVKNFKVIAYLESVIFARCHVGMENWNQNGKRDLNRTLRILNIQENKVPLQLKRVDRLSSAAFISSVSVLGS